MKKILTILLLLLAFTACEENRKDLEAFNNLLGTEKTDAFNEGIEAFNMFLDDNYPNQKSQGLQIEMFLKKLSENLEGYGSDSNWIYRTSYNREVLELLENSGMRLEIRKYGYEVYEDGLDSSRYDVFDNDLDSSGYLLVQIEYEIIPGQDSAEFIANKLRYDSIMEEQNGRLDSTLWFNVRGKYIEGLKLIQHRDERIQRYVEAKQNLGNTAYTTAVNEAIDGYEPFDYEDPFIQRILFAEIFWYIMKWDSESRK